MLIYTLEKESVTGLNGEQTECGHLSCDEYSILRLEDVFGQSGDYTFQMKAKAKVNSVIELVVGNENTPISLSTNFQHISLSYENLKVSDKYIEIGFPSGDYWFYNLQLEEGNQETAWSLCLDDLSDAIDLNATWIGQTTQQIGLFAKRSDIDDAKADMKLTADGMITEALKSYVPADKFDDYKIETSTKFEQTDNQFGFYVTKEQVIHNIGVRSGIGRPLFPHLIRHTTATNAIDHGMDVTDLQKLLGHTRISTTMIYAKVTQENVRYSHHRYVV